MLSLASPKDDASDAMDAEEYNFVDLSDLMGELNEVAEGTAEKLLAPMRPVESNEYLKQQTQRNVSIGANP
eukprot:scaffold59947_cov73-Cyclotella_meneghiniana.AAC.6